MTEYHTVSLGKKLAYDGYFDFAKLWRVVRNFMEDRGWVYVERQHNEIVKEAGKDIFIEVDIHKTLSDYTKGRIRINCTVHELKDVQVEQDGKTLHLNDGRIELEFETYVMTDYEGRFEDKAFLFFLRTMLEKFVYERQIKKFKSLVEKDQDALIKEIKAYLNLFSY